MLELRAMTRTRNTLNSSNDEKHRAVPAKMGIIKIA